LTIFGQRRGRHADGVALCGRVQAQVGVADRLLDGRGHFLFKRDHADGAGVDQGQVGHLADRGRVAVVLDHDGIQQADVGAAGTDFREVGLEGLDRLGHARLRIVLYVS
jgi:hypothetical protein